MSVQTNEKLISEKLVAQLKNSLASITVKFEELQKMYDKLIESVNSKESFQQIKNFVTKKKLSSDIEAIDIDNLPRFKNVPDAQKVFTKLKEEIKERDDKIARLQDSINELTMKKNTKNENRIKKIHDNEFDVQKILLITQNLSEDLKSVNLNYEQIKMKMDEFQKKIVALQNENELLKRNNENSNLYMNKFEDMGQEYSERQYVYENADMNHSYDENEKKNVYIYEGLGEKEKEQTNRHRKRKPSRTRKRK